MRALCWHGTGDVRVDTVPDPRIEHPRDAIIRITACAICGSDLHLLDGYQPTMKSGDILGHENMGEVIELGAEVSNLKIGDRVVVPFTISCGQCWFCRKGLFSACDRTNPNAELAAKAMGQSPAGLFGFSHMMGGYSGGQAEYLRVPMADIGPIKIPDSVTDEQALFLSDIFPTGYMAAENAQIQPGDTVAIWGCGPVGQFAIRSALMMGAGRVIAIDEVPERLAMAQAGGAETIDFSKVDVYDELMSRTAKRGPDSCIDAVGCEATGHGAADAILDKVKTTVMLATDRVHVLREAIMCCRKGGTISIPGVYVGMADKIPLGAAMNKGLTLKMGQTHVQAYTRPLLEKIKAGEIDPSFVVTHPAALEDAPAMYKKFRDKKDGVIKVMLRPGG
jgi:threonine dehydrogenase-like Zn-dependent dehydrogenase